MYNKEEEQYYASMVQKYRSEYRGKNLRGFCYEYRVSYQKMLHCLRDESYRRSQSREVEENQEQGLHPLEVGQPQKEGNNEAQFRTPSEQESTHQSVPDFLLDDVNISFGSGISLHIGTCSKSALISLIKEMEGLVC